MKIAETPDMAWDRALGPIAQLILSDSSRLIAIAGYVGDSGVSTTTARLATILTRADAAVAVVDLSVTPVPTPSNDLAPAERRWWSEPELAPGGYAKVSVSGALTAFDLLHNAPLIRRVLDHDFASYNHVLMDLGPINIDRSGGVPVLGAAAAADALLLVCLRGVVTRPQILETAHMLEKLGIATTGVIVNDRVTRSRSSPERKYAVQDRHDLASDR